MTAASPVPIGRRLAEAVADLFPGYFALVMATGIVSIAAHLQQMPRIAWLLFGINVCAYVVLAVMFVVRLLAYFPRVVQDLGSQLTVEMAGEIAGKQVLDFCAGGGGKTLALAARMGNTGQLYAYDADARRMADVIPRAQRAGVRNLQVRSPVEPEALKGLDGRMDVVFVDAPCTGSGTWRRHPDTKWRLTPEQLERRMAEQDAVLDQAAPFVKPGGRMVYVTCSLFAEENEDRLEVFLARRPDFALAQPGTRMTPLEAGTDGFFVAVLTRSSEPK